MNTKSRDKHESMNINKVINSLNIFFVNIIVIYAQPRNINLSI